MLSALMDIDLGRAEEANAALSLLRAEKTFGARLQGNSNAS